MTNAGSPCERCEVLPPRLTGDFDIYLSAPIMGTRDILVDAIAGAGFSFDFVDDIIRVAADAEHIRDLTDALSAVFGRGERTDTRILVTGRGRTPSLADFIHMESLDSFIAKVEGELVLDLLEGKRLVTYVHPIVQADNPSSIFAAECLTRGIDGEQSLVPPGKLFGTARRAGLLFYLDRESRITAIRSGAPLKGRSKLFVNFNPTAIYRPEYCLRTTLAVLEDVGLETSDVIFEVVESDHVEDTDHLASLLDFYRERGFQVALDDLGSGYNSLTSLYQLRPDYMKLDMDLVRDVDRDPFKGSIVRNLLTLARDLDIRTIAEGIEREGELEWVKNAGADYVQGYLFGRPQPVEEFLDQRNWNTP